MATTKKSEEVLAEIKEVHKTIREFAESIKTEDTLSEADFKERIESIKASVPDALAKADIEIDKLFARAAQLEDQAKTIEDISLLLKDFLDKGEDQLEQYFFDRINMENSVKTVSEILGVEPMIQPATAQQESENDVKSPELSPNESSGQRLVCGYKRAKGNVLKFFKDFGEEFKRTEESEESNDEREGDGDDEH